jgi:predicted alpha/beta-fold hydrolase
MIPNRLAFTFFLLAMLTLSAPNIIAADVSGGLEEHHPEYPPEFHELVIDSSGSRMAALAYVAAGKGPHPTVILLHGYPGNEKNLDLAQAIRHAGWNVLFFHYRGAWGSEGEFSLTGSEADVQAAIDFLRDTRTQAQLRVDPVKLALVGHSMGGHMALAGLTGDSGTICAVSLDGANIGALAMDASQARNSSRDSNLTQTACSCCKVGMVPLRRQSSSNTARHWISSPECSR